MVKQEIEVRQTILTSKIGYNKYRRRADDFNNFSSISILEQLTSTKRLYHSNHRQNLQNLQLPSMLKPTDT